MNSEDRFSRIHRIYESLLSDTSLPLYEYRTHHAYLPVVGEGSLHASIMLIGEAPGEKEALSGKPFCGAAGRILSELLSTIQLEREDVYITNIVKDRPPKNRDPLPAEIEAYAHYLDEQIDVVQPRVIGTLGRFSSDYILKRYVKRDLEFNMKTMHGRTFSASHQHGLFCVIPLYHPAVALYRNSMKPTLVHDIQILKKASE